MAWLSANRTRLPRDLVQARRVILNGGEIAELPPGLVAAFLAKTWENFPDSDPGPYERFIGRISFGRDELQIGAGLGLLLLSPTGKTLDCNSPAGAGAFATEPPGSSA